MDLVLGLASNEMKKYKKECDFIMKAKNIISGFLVGVGVFTIFGYAYAHIIPGVDEPFDPGAYYSETAISYADSPSTFTMRDLAGNGWQVKDVTRGIKNALSEVQTYTQAVSEAQRLQNKILDMTGLSAETSSRIRGQIQQFFTTTETINQSGGIDNTYDQSLFRTTETVGDPTKKFNIKNQQLWLNDFYKNSFTAARANVADTSARATAIEDIIDTSNSAVGRLAAEEANTAALAMQSAEIARRNALLTNYAAVEAAHDMSERDHALQAAQETRNNMTFRVANPYEPATTDQVYKRPEGVGFIDF